MQPEQTDTPNNLSRRTEMIERQVRARGVRDERVLEAMLRVPREQFLPVSYHDAAYDDKALPIDHSQTISQPFIVAYMTALLKLTPTSRVLEIGTGSGYQTALLAQLATHVYTVERIADLQVGAAHRLDVLGLRNVTFVVSDGSNGLPEQSPFDAIIVTAGAPRVPPSLVAQLADGGRLAIPVGDKRSQRIVCVVRHGLRTVETPLIGCRFVNLIGDEAWPDN